MAYSEIELQTRDIDIFFKEKNKMIHLATAGGLIPQVLINNDIANENYASNVRNLPEQFQIEINPNLVQLLSLEPDTLNDYLLEFTLMAKRGFYSYDKTNLGQFNDPTFHLVAKPKEHNKESILRNKNLTEVKSNLPEKFSSFNLFELFE